MTAYVDSSALLKRYVDEVDSNVAEELLGADPVLVTSWITVVEVRRLRIPQLTFITFDLRQAQAARSMGLVVLGS